VVNSRDAIAGGGRITIETANAGLDEVYARQHAGVQPGRYVMLAVTDTGSGMDAETRSRLFEPFFTTKELGKGTGLGLSTVYGIVQQSGGHIWVYSEPGQGTTFKIYLPRVDEPAESLIEFDFKDLRGSETILLVEDEEGVRGLIREILEMSGYSVLEAHSSDEATQICEQHGGPIHLLLTDVVMPRISGPALAEKLRGLRPNIRMLYMSGYTDRGIVEQGILDSRAAFIQKPLTKESLTRKLREVLDSPQRAAG